MLCQARKDSNEMKVYVLVRQSKKRQCYALRYNGTSHILKKFPSEHSHRFALEDAYALKYLRANGVTGHITLVSSYISLVRVLDSAKKWGRLNWPISSRTSAGQFKYYQATGRHDDGIPKNYVKDGTLQALKQLYALSDKVSSKQCSNNDIEMQGLKATVKIGLAEIKAHPKSMKSLNIEHYAVHQPQPLTNVSQQFDLACLALNKSPHDVIKHLKMNYISEARKIAIQRLAYQRRDQL